MHRLIRYCGCLAVATALVLVAAPTPPAAAADEALTALLERVQYWEERGRTDKVAEIWVQVLRSKPRHAEALASLALHNARTGKKDKARGYLDRLIQHHPRHPKIDSLKQAVGLGVKYGDILAAARGHASAGRLMEAIAAYRKLFGSQRPSGNIGLEFYQTLGGTDHGWEEAKAGLERLSAEQSNAPRYELALARHLTYRDATRRAGIDKLRTLAATAGGVGTRADASLKRALLWLHASRADAPMFKSYLQRHPDDEEIRTRLDELTGVAVNPAAPKKSAADISNERVKAGFDALEKKDEDAAEKHFKQVMKNRRADVDALVGLAVVALRKEEFARAKTLLIRVKKLAPQRKEMWEQSLQSAEFWDMITRGRAARDAGDFQQAIELFEQAAQRSPQESQHARDGLASVYEKSGNHDKAEQVYEDILDADAENVEALKALVELHLRTGRGNRAINANERLRKLDPEAGYKETWLRAEVLRNEATELRNEGDLAGARDLLEVARQASPDNTRVLFDLTYVALEAGDTRTARSAVNRLRQLEPKSQDVKIADAWVLSAEKRHKLSLRALDGIARKDMNKATRKLRDRLKIQAMTALAVQQAHRGKPIAARHKLIELQHQVGDDPEMVGLVALAWAELGALDRGTQMIYDALAEAPEGAGTLKLQLASMLHTAGRDEELFGLFRELEADITLTSAERKGLADLRIAHAVKLADAQRERGRIAGAFNALSLLLKDYPSDSRLLTALGRLLVSAGEHDEAAKVFKKVLATSPKDLEARDGAVRSHVKMGDNEGAYKLIEDGMSHHPNHPRMHLIAARMNVMMGEDGQAMEHYERALALEQGQNGPGSGEAFVPGSDYSDLIQGAMSRLSGEKSTAETPDLSIRGEIVQEMDDIRSRHSSRIDIGFGTRFRDGEPGLGRLTEFTVPVAISIPTGYKGRLTFTGTPTLLDAGTLDLDNAFTGDQHGTAGVDLFGQERGSHATDLAGISLGLEYEYRAWKVSGGSTPLGFPFQTGVGSFQWGQRFGDFGLQIRAFREAVTDSVLSFGGSRDVATGAQWGGVTRNGGRLDLAIISDSVLYYLYGGANMNLGELVPSNLGIEAGAGVHWTLHDWAGDRVVAGFSLTGLSYDQNLRHFTFGHGGYFSPQFFLNVAVPLRWRGTSGSVDYGLSADIGLNWFNEDEAPYYPNDPARQAARQDPDFLELEEPEEEGEELVLPPAFHPGQTSFAFAINVSGHLTWRINERFGLGLEASYHSGHEYDEFIGALTVGYAFDKKVRTDSPSKTPFQDY